MIPSWGSKQNKAYQISMLRFPCLRNLKLVLIQGYQLNRIDKIIINKGYRPNLSKHLNVY